MNQCPSCGGVIGTDCFNPQDCAMVSNGLFQPPPSNITVLAERLFIAWNPLSDNQKCYEEFAKRAFEAATIFYETADKHQSRQD